MRKLLIFILLLIMMLITNTGCTNYDYAKAQGEIARGVNEESIRIRTENTISNLIVHGFVYDESKDRYINKDTGIWVLIRNGVAVIPSEEYIDPSALLEHLNVVSSISSRHDDVWKLQEIKEVIAKENDTLVNIISDYFFYELKYESVRMDYTWYAKQVVELNQIKDPNFIKVGDIIKIPVYIDSGSKSEEH